MSDETTCNGKHWHIDNGQLMLTADTEEKKELVKGVIEVLDKQIRLNIYNAIIDWQPLANRRLIMKRARTLDNALLAVQEVCAEIALGKHKDKQ